MKLEKGLDLDKTSAGVRSEDSPSPFARSMGFSPSSFPVSVFVDSLQSLFSFFTLILA